MDRLVLLTAALGLAACSRLSAPAGAFAGGGPPPIFNGSASRHQSISLTAIAPETNRVRVDWETINLDGFNGDFGLYISTDRNNLFNSTPVPMDITQGTHIFAGLLDQTRYFVGVGLAANSGDALLPVDHILSTKTGTFFYVDPTAPITSADGLTPATAYPSLFLGVLTAFLNGGGSVLVTSGTLTDISVPLLSGVDLYGAFGADFSLESRDPMNAPTMLKGRPGDSMLLLEASDNLQRVDSFDFDGLGASINGIDIDQTPGQLTNLNIQNCTRGIRLRSPSFSLSDDVYLSNVQCENNTLEGLSLQGPFSMTLDNCLFQSNGQEGLQFGPWVAPATETVVLRIRDCRFLANGFEGLDVAMSAGLTAGPGGVFDLDIEDCDFDQNVGHGCLVDVDFETSPTWSLELVMRGCQAVANLDRGFSFDLDSSSTSILHRLVASGNRGDGLVLTSETYAAMTLISSSAFVGNMGYGLHSFIGNVGFALSHCVLSGNALGGLRDEIAPATMGSSVAHLQPLPFGAAYLSGTPLVSDTPAPFMNTPSAFRSLSALSMDVLTLDSALGAGIGLAVEVAGDGVLRNLDSIDLNTVQLTPTPVGPQLPALLALFPVSNSVDEDYGPSLGSSLLGAGLQPPLGATSDAGPLGSPTGGAPGAEDLFPVGLFRVAAQIPAWGRPIGANAALCIQFLGGLPGAASLGAGVNAIDGSGASLSISPSVQAGELVIPAPSGGWRSGDRIQLHATLLAATTGLPLVPIVLLVGAG